MSTHTHPIRAITLALVVTVSVIVGVGAVSTPATAAQSISDQRNIASHADSTTQQFSFEFDLPPQSITCTLKASDTLGQYGVTLKSASVSGTDKLSMSVKSNGDVDMTIQSGSGTESATVTLTMSTEEVTIPDEPQEHQADCSGGGATASLSNPVQTQASGFTIEETGIKDTEKTTIHSDDTTIENDTTMTQSIDLDLVVPDDGDGDGDTYDVTIDTQEALANGINVTGASVETDPSGADSQIEVDDTIVEGDENVTVTISEAAANHSDGNISRETITVALDLDATQHDAGTFQADDSIAHVISDEAGNTTSTVTFSSTISETSNGSDGSNETASNPMRLDISAPTTSPNSTVTVEFNFTNTNDTSLSGPAVKVTDIPSNWTVASHDNADAEYSSDPPTWLWLSVGAKTSKKPTLTLEVPNDTAPGDYTIGANATQNDLSTVSQTATVTVSENGSQSVDEAIAGSDGTIGISDIQQAIGYWANGEAVPDTGGQTINLTKIQELIQTWAAGGQISS